MSKLTYILVLIICCLSIVSVFTFDGHGKSKIYSKQDGKGNYAFGYNVLNPKGDSNYREESGDAWGNKAGSYGLKDKDGRLRIVHYVADKNGFRVKIDSNEPGVASVDSAHTRFNGPDHHQHHSKVAHVTHHKPHVHHQHPEPRHYDQHQPLVPAVPAIPALKFDSIPHVGKTSIPMEKQSDEYDVDIPAIGDLLN